jgi:hypothetical protein
MADEPPTDPRVELVAVVVLAVTAVLTAWTGFQASKWSGEMAISFSRASSARVEAARDAATADAARGYDLDIFGVYVQAVADGDTRLQEFVQTRFTDHFAVAFDAWVAQRPLEDPEAPRSPFALAEYVPPGQQEAAAADARADDLFAQALRNNQRGDDYTLLTVLFALVLFFSAVATRLRSRRSGWVVLSAAVGLLVVGSTVLASFPKIV